MFGMSFTEIVIIAILALVLLGPDQLPDAAKTLAKTFKDIKKATDGLKDQVETELYQVEKKIKQELEVPPVASAAMAASQRTPATPVAATAQNVPGLDAALVEPAAPPEPPPAEPATTKTA
jgi:sec-independent protein translocase protein TatB